MMLARVGQVAWLRLPGRLAAPTPLRRGDRVNAPAPSPEDASFLERLQKEVEEWKAEGLVQPDQAHALLARYGLVPGQTSRTLRRSRIVYVLAVLGAVLIGVGVILVMGANWQYLPKWFRLALLICATAASYHCGYRMAYRSQTYPKVGMGLLLLGSLLWGASIFLVAQMYHLGGEGGETAAVLYWFIGVLPLAYILLSPLHLVLSLVIGTVWLGMMLNLTFGEPYGAPPQMYAMFALGVGIFLYAFGRLHSAWAAVRRLAPAYRWFGVTFIFGALYAFSFRGLLEWGTGIGGSYGTSAYVLYWVWRSLMLTAAGAATLALFLREGQRDRASFYEGLALLGFLFLCAAISMDGLAGGSYALMALFNLLLFGAEIGAVAMGWARNEPALTSAGIFVFFVQVMTRYFDLLGGMLMSGLGFICAGFFLIILGAILERSRRRLLDAMVARREP